VSLPAPRCAATNFRAAGKTPNRPIRFSSRLRLRMFCSSKAAAPVSESTPPSNTKSPAAGWIGQTDQVSRGNQQNAWEPPGTVSAEIQPSVGLQIRAASSGHFNAPRSAVGCHRSCSIVRPAAAVTTLFRSKQCGENARRTYNPHYNAAIPAVKKLLQHFLAAQNLAGAARRLPKYLAVRELSLCRFPLR